ncbi:MAG: peptidase [Acidimicrobiaceae bacterium]|nr:peptidase [Acidimicrobiaceae bacterium]
MPDPAPFARFPALSGDQLAFVADDDLWVAEADGGGARRLTAENAALTQPRFSPDGSLLAFASRRDGASEVNVVSLFGGPARRLTFWGDPSTRVLGWRDPETVIAISATGEPFRSRTWARTVPVSGGPSERLAYGPITSLASSSRGVVVLGVNQSARRGAAWKRYRGGTAGALWIDRDGSGNFTRFLTELHGQLEDPHWIGDRLAFVSDHEGYANVYSVRADGTDLRRHSDHAQFYARALSGDGRRLAYQHAGGLYILDDLEADSQPRRLDIRLEGAIHGRAPRPVSAEEHLGDFAPDVQGRSSLVEMRGSIQQLAHRDGPARLIGGGAGVRGRLPLVAGSGVEATALFVTDAEGEDALEVVALAGPSAERRRLGAGELGRVLELAVSPDAKFAAVASHDGRLLVVELARGAVRVLDRAEDGDVSGLSFSPDSRLLAWSHPGPEPLSQIRVGRLSQAGGGDEVIEMTPLRFEDREPVFTTDGRYLAFLSVRTFDPVYDAHVFDLSFPSAARPYLLPLAAATPSPFAPEFEGRPRPGAKAPESPPDVGGGEAPGSGREAEGPGSAVPEVVLDNENLSDRLVAVPVAAGRYSRLRAAEGGLVFMAEPVLGVLGEERERPDAPRPRPTLLRYDFATRRQITLADSVDAYEVSGDGRSLVVRDDKALRSVPADRRAEAHGEGPDDDVIEIDLSRLRLEVDPGLEWRQMYDEAARLMRDHYFVEDMAGVDWPEVVERYRPLVDRVATRDELSELLWEVQGELATSHAYERPPEQPTRSERRLGRLGADLASDSGQVVVRRVVPGESSVPSARSPLAAPGVAVSEGDAIVEVDGRPVDPKLGIGPLLLGTADKPVALAVRPAAGGALRRVVVVPLADEGALRYQDWVAGRRAAVHAASNGRVGYLHVPDMVGSGWAQLHRDLRLEVRREALIVDVRENRGGHVSELVVEKLSRTVRGWDVARHRGASTYPHDAPRGPLVAVADEQAGSDGDIVTAAFKLYGLGPVVGKRTWGGVIGIDSAYRLVDGTSVTQPRYAFWFDGGLGWDVENHGVEPDVEVDMAPQDWAAGRDPQLERAVELALDELSRRPAAVPPPVSTRPSHAPPALPARPRTPPA